MKELLNKAGVLVLGYIHDNIRLGKDYEEKNFSYSDKPFFRPFDPKIYAKLKNMPELAQVVTSKSTGKLGFIIQGYGKFKQYIKPGSATNFLTWDGSMLGGMKIISFSDTEAVIGWSEGRLAQKAFWFNQAGVGKSRKLWKFLGITNQQKLKLIEKLGAEYRNIAIKEMGKIIANYQA